MEVRGHHIANLDPLHISDADMDSRTPPELKLDYYGWTEEDLKKEFSIKNVLPRFVNAVPEGKMTLGQIIEACRRRRCGEGRGWQCGVLGPGKHG
jgi:2-oxoglutarate dehydrogenase E1 component